MSVPATEKTPSAVPEPATPEPPKPAPPEPDKAPKDWEKEAEKWRTFARKHEDAAKANADKAKQFDALEESQKTELQKVLDQAAKFKTEADTTRGELAVMRAAVKYGLSAEDLELLGTHGTTEEIDARAEKLAARLKVAAGNRPPVDFGGGDRGGNVTDKPQFDEQIAAAMKAGQFQQAIALEEQRAALIKKP